MAICGRAVQHLYNFLLIFQLNQISFQIIHWYLTVKVLHGL